MNARKEQTLFDAAEILMIVLAVLWSLFQKRRRPERSRSKTKYARYLRSEKWRKIANRVKKRDGHKCTECGSTKRLHVHHLHYRNIYREKLKDLITLCADCHARVHGLNIREVT